MPRIVFVLLLFMAGLAFALHPAFPPLASPARAQEHLPPDAVTNIKNAARSGQQPNYALSAAVISALTYYPAHVEEIIAQAVIADPRSYRLVVREATSAFPRFASRIKDGADGDFRPPHPPMPEEQSRIGLLTCEAIPGTRWNFIITSSVELDCAFKTSQGVEHYKGETGITLGVDLDFKASEQFAFAVLGIGAGYRIGSYMMTGKYVGAKVSASAGVGLGVAALAGGGKGNFTLEPLVLERNIGLGAAAGLGYLYIEPAGR